MRQAHQNLRHRAISLPLFVMHNISPKTLRFVYRLRGERMRLFGGATAAKFFAARELMAEENEKIDWIWGPIADRADYLTKSYMPFLQAGPNQRLRRQHIQSRVAEAHGKLADLEALLADEKETERALCRFLYRHFGGIELDPSEVDGYLDFRKHGRFMLMLPKWVRTKPLRRTHERIRAFRSRMLRRMEAAGVPIADSLFDVIWFNAGTLGSYPERAVKILRERPDLCAIIEGERNLPPTERPKTRAMIHEMLRIYSGIASTNYLRHGRDVEVAVIATAAVDPLRYARPLEVDLDRDHSDVVAFSGSAPTRSCPAQYFAPDVMACVLAYRVKSGALA